MQSNATILPPTSAFVGASWLALAAGVLTYSIGLWNNAAMQLNEKGYYFAVLVLGLFAAVSLQKTVRDRAEGVYVTGTYAGLCWAALAIALLLLVVGLFNATFSLGDKGFFGISYTLALFAVVAVQKNVRDLSQAERSYSAAYAEPLPQVDEPRADDR